MDASEFREKQLHKFLSSVPKKGIYEILSRCKIVKVSPKNVLYEFIVEEKDLDEENNFHNGSLATLFDALMSRSGFPVDPGVTVDLNITYCKNGRKINV
uniref:Thioesterase domain-containing protein n=1 Tax=Panagrolaimus sp. PS1159 TaxID=55785 RepID=A0AC35GNC5_9BILA